MVCKPGLRVVRRRKALNVPSLHAPWPCPVESNRRRSCRQSPEDSRRLRRARGTGRRASRFPGARCLRVSAARPAVQAPFRRRRGRVARGNCPAGGRSAGAGGHGGGQRLGQRAPLLQCRGFLLPRQGWRHGAQVPAAHLRRFRRGSLLRTGRLPERDRSRRPPHRHHDLRGHGPILR